MFVQHIKPQLITKIYDEFKYNLYAGHGIPLGTDSPWEKPRTIDLLQYPLPAQLSSAPSPSLISQAPPLGSMMRWICSIP